MTVSVNLIASDVDIILFYKFAHSRENNVYVREDFKTFGYTVGCPGCDQLQIGGFLRRNHTDACRDRIEVELD